MMPSSSNARKKRDSDADSDDSSDSISSKPNSDEQPSTSTNAPSSVVATVSTSTGGTRHQTAQPATLPLDAAAAAAAPTAPQSEKKARRAGFREQFLQKLRVMLDRESQIGGTAVRWSPNGSSFIITDHNSFEEQLIPMYFGNQIVFSSFLRRLQRWGFKRVSNRRNGQYEYSSPTFKRLDYTAATAGNDGGVAFMQTQQQQQQQQQVQAASLLHQVMAQLSQPQSQPPPPPLPSQALADSNAAVIADLISNLQRSGQHPSVSSQQQPIMNQNVNANQIDAANTISILQSIMGSNQQQQQPSQNSLPSQHPVRNHASLLNNIDSNNYQQSSPQQQHQNPMMNVLNAILNNSARGSTPTSSTQVVGHSTPSSQNSLVHALLSLSGIQPQSPLPNSNATLPAASQPMDITLPAQTLVMLFQRINEEEQQRRAQVDAIQSAVMASIGHILSQGDFSINNQVAQSQQQGFLQTQLSRLSTGSNNNNDNTAAQPLNGDALPPAAADLNINQRLSQLGWSPGEMMQHERAERSLGEAGGPLSSRKGKSTKDDEHEADDDSWNEALKQRKKPPRK